MQELLKKMEQNQKKKKVLSQNLQSVQVKHKDIIII